MKKLIARFKKTQSGFTLVEILVFISVFSVALVALISSVAYSAMLLNNARYRVMATRQSEELAEWLKFQREYYLYDSILTKASEAGTTYCFNNADIGPLQADWVESGSCEDNYDLNNFYLRSLTLKRPTALVTSPITAQISTSYRFLNLTRSVIINLSFNDYGQ